LKEGMGRRCTRKWEAWRGYGVTSERAPRTSRNILVARALAVLPLGADALNQGRLRRSEMTATAEA
jgi:hypothetical protein